MMTSGIYKITNILNGKCYVGSTMYLHIRMKSHFAALHRNKHENNHLQNAWNKDGKENFLFEIIEEVVKKEKLLEREQFYLDTLLPEYNICKVAGNCLGKKATKETKQKMSLRRKGKIAHNKGIPMSEETRKIKRKQNNGKNNPFFGKNHSEESKQKMSQIRKGKIPKHVCKLTWELVRKIRKEFIFEKDTYAEYSRRYNVSETAISKIIKMKTWIE